jgi:hypothetical protein
MGPCRLPGAVALIRATASRTGHHETEEYDMNDIVYVDKAEVIAQLHARQLHDRAHWVDRQLPGKIDAVKNHSLLQMLGIDLDAATPEELASPLGPAAKR